MFWGYVTAAMGSVVGGAIAYYYKQCSMIGFSAGVAIYVLSTAGTFYIIYKESQCEQCEAGVNHMHISSKRHL